MSAIDLQALLPLIAVAGTAVLVMLAIAIHRHHAVTAALSFAGLAAALASLAIALPTAPHRVAPLFIIDRYALLYTGLFLAASMVFIVLAYDYFEKCEGHHDEIYLLMLVATLGACVLAASTNLISLFLGLEVLTVPLYAMIAYLQKRPLPLEAGLKYLVLAAISAAFLLFGIALIYTALGTMEFTQIAAMFSTPQAEGLVLPGLALMVTGLGFKLAVVPFHFWVPDVYEGAPAPVTAYLATVSKGAILAVLLRFFHNFRVPTIPSLWLIFTVVALASMVAGNLLALLQQNVKRMLAYSSIAHLGYMLVAFQVGGDLGPAAVTFYLAAYIITILGSFGVISVLSNGEREFDRIDDFRGLFWRRPLIASIFTTTLLSLAGIPLTAGFIAKFYIVAAGTSQAIWALVFTLVVTSAVGLYYYLRVIVAMYARSEAPRVLTPSLRAIPNLTLVVLGALLLWLGILPGSLLQIIQRAVAG